MLTNNTAIWAFLHAVTASLLTAGAFVAAICAWLMVRSHRRDEAAEARTMYRPAAILGSFVALVAAVGLLATGDVQGKLMFVQQPMKMASAESLCHTETDPDFSILTVGTHNNCDSITRVLEVPYVLPFLAESKFSGGVTLEGGRGPPAAGRGEVRARKLPAQPVRHLLGVPRDDRAAAGAGGVRAAEPLAHPHGGPNPGPAWYGTFALLTIPTPFLASSAGWIFTEMGRQPWVVVPNPTGDQMVRMVVQDGVSNNAAGTVLFSLAVFTLLYGALAVAWFFLMRRYVTEGPLEHDSEPAPPTPPDKDDVAPLSFAY